jgi:hypothetical protein
VFIISFSTPRTIKRHFQTPTAEYIYIYIYKMESSDEFGVGGVFADYAEYLIKVR